MTSSKSSSNESQWLTPIGRVVSPYGQKFAVPRQGLIAAHAPAYLIFNPPYDTRAAFTGLDGFSHLYVLFLFHQVPDGPFRPTVRPPRLGGNRHLGVFATRSPYRPSRLGLSLVRLEAIEDLGRDKVRLKVLGADMVDGTPIVDIKPYIPFVDSIPEAQGGFAQSPPDEIEVSMPESLALQLRQSLGESAYQAILEILRQDPRPAYKGRASDDKDYFARLYGYDLKFKVRAGVLYVTELIRLAEQGPAFNFNEEITP